MFGFKKKKETKNLDSALYAPCTGTVFKIEEVSDPVFSQKMMGEGYAMEPLENEIYAPSSGTVTVQEGHAIGLTRADGLEVLLHIGIDTVNLAGVPFEISCKLGDTLIGGQAIGKVDFEAIEAAGLEKTEIVVFTNTADRLDSFKVDYREALAGEKLGSAEVKA